jgi:Ni/Fe-hydrogenase 1 B-type cytochrome subunit
MIVRSPVPAPQIRRVLVWSTTLRIVHAVIALSVIVLLATGWLLDHDAALYPAARDYHFIAGYALLGALAIRLPMLVSGQGPAHLRALLPTGEQRRAAIATLRFYLSLARAPLPRWYAHNPLWGPLYLAMFALLLVAVATGLSYDVVWSVAGLDTAGLHGLVARILFPVVLAHVIAVILHDLRGTSADVSGIINGHRFFAVEPLKTPIETPPAEIDLHELTRGSDSGRDRNTS